MATAMTTIDLTDQAFRDAIDAICAELDHPPYTSTHSKAKLTVARDLVLEGAVQPTEQDHTYTVRSSSDPTDIHVVDPKTCDCRAARYKQLCAHVIAVEIYTTYYRQAWVSRVPGMPEAAEAPARPRAPDTSQEAPQTAQEEDMTVDPTPDQIAHPGPSSTVSEPLPAPVVHQVVLPPITRRSIQAIVADLSRPLPEACVAHREEKSQDGKKITIDYLHWYDVAAVLDTYAPGWAGTVVRCEVLCSKVVITYRLTIPCLEGVVSQEDVGFEEQTLTAYGDPFSNAEAMAFKRAAAKFGVGRWLYHKETSVALAQHLKAEKVELLQAVGTQLKTLGWPGKAVIRQHMAQTGTRRLGDLTMHALAGLREQLEAVA